MVGTRKAGAQVPGAGRSLSLEPRRTEVEADRIGQGVGCTGKDQWNWPRGGAPQTSGRGRRRGAWLSRVQRIPESPRPELLPRSLARPQPARTRPQAREDAGGHPGGGERSRGSALRAPCAGLPGPAPAPGHGPALVSAPRPIPIQALAPGPSLALLPKSVPVSAWVPANAQIQVPNQAPPPAPVSGPGLAPIPASALVPPPVTNSSPSPVPIPPPLFA